MRKQLTLFCFFIIAAGFAQSQKTDSLLAVLKKATPDTSKVNLLISLCTEFRLTGDLDKGLQYGSEGLKLAEELHWKKGEGEALINIGIIQWSKGNYSQALKKYFDALKNFEELGEENRIANVLGNIGLVHWNQGDYPKALTYYFKSLKINEKINNKQAQAKNIANIGNVYWNQANYDEALKYYFKALKIAEEIGDKNGVCIDHRSRKHRIGLLEQEGLRAGTKLSFQSIKACRRNGIKRPDLRLEKQHRKCLQHSEKLRQSIAVLSGIDENG